MAQEPFEIDEITRGDGRTLTITATYPEAIPGQNIAAGNPYPLTGKTIWFTAKRRISDADADAVISKKTGAGIEVLAGQTNKARITINATDTDDLPDQTVTLACDVQVKEPGKDPWTVAEGRLRVRPDVTRATS